MRLEVCSPRQDFGAEKLLEISLQHDMLQIRRKHPEIMRSSMKIMKDQLLINFWLSWNARRWRKTRSILALTTTRRRESHDPRICKLTQMHCKVSSHRKPISSHFQCFDMLFFFSFVCYTGRSGSFLTVLTKGPRSKDMKSFCTMSPPRGFSKALRPKGAIGAVRSLDPTGWSTLPKKKQQEANVCNVFCWSDIGTQAYLACIQIIQSQRTIYINIL